jgi:hypothetical protein
MNNQTALKVLSQIRRGAFCRQEKPVDLRYLEERQFSATSGDEVLAMRALFSILTQLLLFLFLQVALADAVYRWVDAEGVTHFSETPPADAAGPVHVLDLPPAPPASQETDDYYSVANQAARMEASRLERERVRAEQLRAEAALREAKAAATPEPSVPEEPEAIPVFRYRHYHYPGYAPPVYDYRHDRHRPPRAIPPGGWPYPARPRPYDPAVNQPDRWLRSQ